MQKETSYGTMDPSKAALDRAVAVTMQSVSAVVTRHQDMPHPDPRQSVTLSKNTMREIRRDATRDVRRASESVRPRPEGV